MYSASTDGVIKKIKVDEAGHYSVAGSLKLAGAPAYVCDRSPSHLYVLQNNNKVALISKETFTLDKEVEFTGFEATALVFCAGKLWVGDKKGTIHVLDGTSLEQSAAIEKKHNHAVTSMSATTDTVITGDAYRYVYLFNGESQAETGCFAHHTSKITSATINKSGDRLLIACLDNSFSVVNLATKAKQVFPRCEKILTAAVF